MLTSDDMEPCPPDGPCQVYWPGHQMHVIHAKHVGRTPWGWRTAVVRATHTEGRIDLEYGDGTDVRAWHHQPLALVVGERVGLHEQYHALRTGGRLVNIALDGGAGAVPEPDDLDAWADRMTGGVQDVTTGYGVPLNDAGLPDTKGPVILSLRLTASEDASGEESAG